MTHFKYALLLSSVLILAACEPASKQPSALDAGHDHAAMQAGQSQQSKMDTPAEEVTSYTCPMHPHYIATDPDGSCPICGMDLVPVKKSASSAVQGKGDILYYKNPMGLPDTSPVPKKDTEQPLYLSQTLIKPCARTAQSSRIHGWSLWRPPVLKAGSMT